MRLIKLDANQASFKTVRFNETGLSIIVADKKTNHEKNTYNSVGKSLTIALVHFCLASNPTKSFVDKLKGWVFELTFKIDDFTYTVKRSVDDYKIILLNGQSIALEEFRAVLGAELFNLPIEIKHLSFRSLLSRFIRPKRSSYSSYDVYIAEEQPFNSLINSCYLLGLNTQLAIKKYELKKSLDEIKSTKKALDKDSSLKELFSDVNPKTLSIEIFTLQEELERLSRDIASFKIADNYTKLQSESNEVSRRVRDKRNEIVMFRNALSSAQKSLQNHVDISSEKLIELYKEAEIYFKEALIGELTKLEAFHKNLIADRAKFLKEESASFERKIEEAEKELLGLSEMQNETLAFLHSHGALDDYVKMTERQTGLQLKLQKLTQYNEILRSNRIKIENLKKEFSSENIITDEYLESIEDINKKNILLFNHFATSFYEGKASGITIENNTGENLMRYNLNARIQDDKGDAVSEVKIFCFDWTILKAKHNHRMNFLFHDSRILDGVDTRQIAKMFRIANEECALNGFQYVISANHNTLEALKNFMDPDEFRSIIVDNQVLKLSDLSDEGKLLGIQVDLDY